MSLYVHSEHLLGFHIPRGYTSVVACFETLMGIEPTSLGHLIQSTATCYVPWAFAIGCHSNPLIAKVRPKQL